MSLLYAVVNQGGYSCCLIANICSWYDLICYVTVCWKNRGGGSTAFLFEDSVSVCRTTCRVGEEMSPLASKKP